MNTKELEAKATELVEMATRLGIEATAIKHSDYWLEVVYGPRFSSSIFHTETGKVSVRTTEVRWSRKESISLKNLEQYLSERVSK
jgi:hypothetical protein